MFREIQSSTLVAGWWGITAYFVNIAYVLRNLAEIRRHQANLAPPTYRDPAVVTPMPPGVPPVKPVMSRGAPVAATLTAGLIAVMLVAGAVAPSASNPAESSGRHTGPAGQLVIGSCLDASGYRVSCSNSAATWTLNREVASQYECAYYETVFQARNGRVFCAQGTP